MINSNLPLDLLDEDQFTQIVDKIINRGLENIPWYDYTEEALGYYFNEISKNHSSPERSMI
jgi:hypothetical protein